MNLLEAFKTKSAGIVLIKFLKNKPHVLCLKTHDGRWDLPKGKIDPGEDAFGAAARETQEEAGISNVKFPWGMISHNGTKTILFIGVTIQPAKISKNPHTKKYEHASSKWISISSAKNIAIPHLRPGLAWAESVITTSSAAQKQRRRHGLRESVSKAVNMTAAYANDLKLALNWLTLNNAATFSDEVTKKGDSYLSVIHPLIEKGELELLIKDRFGSFVHIN